MAHIGEVFSTGRVENGKGVTLGVAAYLYKPEEGEFKQSPFSRFVFSFIENESSVKANLKPDEKVILKQRYNTAVDMMLKSRYGSAAGSSPAYTVKLTGVFNKKTAVEVLSGSDAEAQLDRLLSSKKWLEENVAKYPSNKTMIAAIDDGIALYKKGALKPVVAPAFTLFESEVKYFTTEKDGKRLCYSLRINFDGNRNFPFCVTVENFWAPLKDKKVQLSLASEKSSRSMNLSELEMAGLMGQLDFAEECFVHSEGAAIFDKVKEKYYSA